MTGFPNPLYGEEEETEQYWVVVNKIQEKIGRHPDSYSVAAYDTMWIATLACLSAGTSDDSAVLQQIMEKMAATYFGATGWTVLNEAGDRQYYDYDFWAVREDKGSYQWKRVARYQVDPGESGKLITE